MRWISVFYLLSFMSHLYRRSQGCLVVVMTSSSSRCISHMVFTAQVNGSTELSCYGSMDRCTALWTDVGEFV